MSRTPTTEPAKSTSAAPPQVDGHPHKWRVLAVLAAVAFMAQLDLFIVNIAVPSIGGSFRGSSFSSLSWVLNAYAVVFAALLVPAGRLADHFGRRRFLLAGVLAFTAASVICAVSPDLAVLIIGRALQAAGAALIVPTSLGLLYPAFPRHQHSLVVGVWAGVAAVAASSGPPIGGLLVDVDWRWIFIVNVPIGIATLLAGRRILPEVRADHGARLPDAASSVLLLLSVALIVVSTVQGPVWGWADGRVIGLFVLAAIATALTVARTVRHPHALIEKTLFHSRPFTAAAIALFMVFVSFAAWLLVTVLFFEDAWHYSAVRAGIAIAPGPAFAALLAVNAGRISRRFGRTLPAALGTVALSGAGIWWYFLATASPHYWYVFPSLLLSGAASGLSQAPLYASVNTLPADRATTGSAVLNMTRQIGSAVGVALLVALLPAGAPHEIAQFRPGWLLMSGSGLGALAAVLIGRQRTQGTQSALDDTGPSTPRR